MKGGAGHAQGDQLGLRLTALHLVARAGRPCCRAGLHLEKMAGGDLPRPTWDSERGRRFSVARR
jgi:hypothetical protein